MNSSRQGDVGEYLAVIWLLSEGWEVFKNVASKGPGDLVAVKNKTILMIDVKYTIQVHYPTGEDKRITYMCIDPDGSVQFKPHVELAFPEKVIPCQSCGEVFEPLSMDHRYCSQSCRSKAKLVKLRMRQSSAQIL